MVPLGTDCNNRTQWGVRSVLPGPSFHRSVVSPFAVVLSGVPVSTLILRRTSCALGTYVVFGVDVHAGPVLDTQWFGGSTDGHPTSSPPRLPSRGTVGAAVLCKRTLGFYVRRPIRVCMQYGRSGSSGTSRTLWCPRVVHKHQSCLFYVLSSFALRVGVTELFVRPLSVFDCLRIL